MLEFPEQVDVLEPPPARMTLREYALFSEQCLLSNPAITPENCLEKRRDGADIRTPFSLGDAGDSGGLVPPGHERERVDLATGCM